MDLVENGRTGAFQEVARFVHKRKESGVWRILFQLRLARGDGGENSRTQGADLLAMLHTHLVMSAAHINEAGRIVRHRANRRRDVPGPRVRVDIPVRTPALFWRSSACGRGNRWVDR